MAAIRPQASTLSPHVLRLVERMGLTLPTGKWRLTPNSKCECDRFLLFDLTQRRAMQTTERWPVGD